MYWPFVLVSVCMCTGMCVSLCKYCLCVGTSEYMCVCVCAHAHAPVHQLELHCYDCMLASVLVGDIRYFGPICVTCRPQLTQGVFHCQLSFSCFHSSPPPYLHSPESLCLVLPLHLCLRCCTLLGGTVLSQALLCACAHNVSGGGRDRAVKCQAAPSAIHSSFCDRAFRAKWLCQLKCQEAPSATLKDSSFCDRAFYAK